MIKSIDMHAHIIPKSLESLIENNTIKGITIETNSDTKLKSIVFNDKSRHPYSEIFYSIHKRLKIMKSQNILKQVISIIPRLFLYDFIDEEAILIHKTFNNDISDVVKEYTGNFIGMGSVPLQNVKASIEELGRLKHELKFKSVQIGTFINGRNLSDEEFVPFFKKAEELGMFVFLHPLIVNENELTRNYHLSNLVGNPVQTTIAITNLMFSGIFDLAPNLKIGLAHGGGFLPYQLGRMQHGYQVRNDTKSKAKKTPVEYVKKNVYFDGLTHSQGALKFLVEEFGSDKVMFGTDYPYDMAEYDQTEKIKALGISKKMKNQILFENAEEFF